MNTYPIRVGSSLFTLVDPEQGHEVAYNRWYERDHFYAGCMVGPWLFAGSRWVATRELKNLRFPNDSPLAVPVDAGSYLAVYWVHEGHHDEHFNWSIKQVIGLYKNGRGFAERVHAHTVLLNKPWSHYRDADPVPIELALDHPYRGLVVLAVDPAEGTTVTDFNDHLSSNALPRLMDGSGIASMASWRYVNPSGGATEQAPMDLGTPPGPAHRQIQIFFCDDEPVSQWPRFRAYADALQRGGIGRVVFAAPFIPTIVGTDMYTDQLW